MSEPFAFFLFERNLGDAVVFIGVFMLFQLALSVGATTWLWIIRYRQRLVIGTSVRQRLLVYATIAYTIAATAAVLIWCGPVGMKANSRFLATIGAIGSLTAFAFAVSGRGRGRILNSISALLLACSYRLYF